MQDKRLFTEEKRGEIAFAGIREHLAMNNVPKAFKGVPIAIISVGILALAFMGFSGMVK